MVRHQGEAAFATGTALAPGTRRLSLREIFRRLQTEPLVWHAHRLNELYVALLVRLLAPPRRVHVVFTRHHATRASWWTRLWARRADLVVALTPEGRDNLGVAHAQLVPHGVDTQVFRPPTTPRTQAFAALGVSDRPLGMGVIGRVRPSKGQGDFVEALAPLLPRFSQWQPLFVGYVKPSQRTWLEQLRARTGGLLAVVDEQPDIARWYQGLAIFVQPSHTEGFSLVLLEAMACGCCVVAPRLPHYPDLIDHGRTGFLYSPNNIEELRALLERLMSAPEEAERVGAAARAEAVQRLGVEHEAQTLLRHYSNVQLATKR